MLSHSLSWVTLGQMKIGKDDKYSMAQRCLSDEFDRLKHTRFGCCFVKELDLQLKDDARMSDTVRV